MRVWNLVRDNSLESRDRARTFPKTCLVWGLQSSPVSLRRTYSSVRAALECTRCTPRPSAFSASTISPRRSSDASTGVTRTPSPSSRFGLMLRPCTSNRTPKPLSSSREHISRKRRESVRSWGSRANMTDRLHGALHWNEAENRTGNRAHELVKKIQCKLQPLAKVMRHKAAGKQLRSRLGSRQRMDFV